MPSNRHACDVCIYTRLVAEKIFVHHESACDWAVRHHVSLDIFSRTKRIRRRRSMQILTRERQQPSKQPYKRGKKEQRYTQMRTCGWWIERRERILERKARKERETKQRKKEWGRKSDSPTSPSSRDTERNHHKNVQKEEEETAKRHTDTKSTYKYRTSTIDDKNAHSTWESRQSERRKSLHGCKAACRKGSPKTRGYSDLFIETHRPV